MRLIERHRRLAPRPESAGLARQAVLEALEDADRIDLADAARLLVSELVTNAIVHARTPIDLEVVAGPDGLRVAVHDGSPNQPTPRHYGASATTGRGLELLGLISHRHGTDSDPGTHSDGHGKTVWFELGTGPGVAEGQPGGPADRLETEFTVRLIGLPVLLGRAWQQHTDALLHELLLCRWDDEGPLAGALPGDDVAAGDAFTAVAAALEALGPVEDLPPYVDALLALRPGRAAHFAELDTLMDHLSVLAEAGQTLAPPTQPEIGLLNRWICEQVHAQAAGQAPTSWPGVPGTPQELPAPARSPVEWDPGAVREATDAVIAGDDADRIIAASGAALRLLGWDEDLIGRRLLSIIPQRLREAHLASFTLHLLTGETHILDREVAVQALRRDGTEVPVLLLVRRENVSGGRAVFTARLRAP